MLAALARYHSWRQLGGVNYNLYKQAGDLAAFDEAIADERKAVQAWHELVEAAGDFYIDNMWFGPTGRGFPHHWKDEMKTLDVEFENLLAERQAASAPADAKPARIPDAMRIPSCRWWRLFKPTAGGAWPGFCRPGECHGSRRREMDSPAVPASESERGLSIRRYDAQRPDRSLCRAAFLASFIDPHWDLMYFIEVVDRAGNGRIYPDLEVETPYIINSVTR